MLIAICAESIQNNIPLVRLHYCIWSYQLHLIGEGGGGAWFCSSGKTTVWRRNMQLFHCVHQRSNRKTKDHVKIWLSTLDQSQGSICVEEGLSLRWWHDVAWTPVFAPQDPSNISTNTQHTPLNTHTPAPLTFPPISTPPPPPPNPPTLFHCGLSPLSLIPRGQAQPGHRPWNKLMVL